MKCEYTGEASPKCAYDSPAAPTSPALTYSAGGKHRTAMYRVSRLKYGSPSLLQVSSELDSVWGVVRSRSRLWLLSAWHVRAAMEVVSCQLSRPLHRQPGVRQGSSRIDKGAYKLHQAASVFERGPRTS